MKLKEVESEETLEVDNEEDSEETGEEHETDTINKGLISLFQNIFMYVLCLLSHLTFYITEFWKREHDECVR